MKRIFKRATLLFSVLLLLASAKINAQDLLPELNISPRPSTRLSDWMSKRETASLYIPNSLKSTDIKIEAKLSLNGTLIVATKTNAMPFVTIPHGGILLSAGDMFPDNAVTFYGDLRASTMRSGILPEGNYELCITLLDAKTLQPVSTTTCRSFSLIKNILPTLLQPEDNKKIISGTEKATLFVWTPMIPIPSTPITYRLRVVEIHQGQSAQQAFYINPVLFEKTTIGTTQLLWPQEIPLPNIGANLAWAVQPEDELGNPYILPERFSNAFTLLVLPSSEECSKISGKIMRLRSDGLKVEEEYWEADGRLQRITQLLEEAEERADALSIQKSKNDQTQANTKLEKIKTTFDMQRTKYDAAVSEYEKCLGR